MLFIAPGVIFRITLGVGYALAQVAMCPCCLYTEARELSLSPASLTRSRTLAHSRAVLCCCPLGLGVSYTGHPLPGAQEVFRGAPSGITDAAHSKCAQIGANRTIPSHSPEHTGPRPLPRPRTNYNRDDGSISGAGSGCGPETVGPHRPTGGCDSTDSGFWQPVLCCTDP